MSLKNKIFARLNSIDVISTPPAIISEVLSLLNQEDSSSAKLSQIILKDPNLTARVLKIANSTFYGYRGQVNNVNQAVMIMGQNMVKCLVLSISIYDQVVSTDPGKEKEFNRLWQHFLETATAAKNVALSIRYEMLEEAYIAGLLHDFGRLFLLRYFAKEVFQANRLLAEGVPLIEAERRLLGTDHQEIGGFIASRWNLPISLIQAIGNHHPPDGKAFKELPILSKIVAISDNLSTTGNELPENLDGAEYRIEIIDACCDSLGLNMDQIKKVYSGIPGEVLGNAEGMGLDLGEAFEHLSQVNAKLFNLHVELASIFRERQELSRRLLNEERLEGTLESLHIALATLSHYINNAIMNISGQCEILQLLHRNGDKDRVFEKIPSLNESIRLSTKRISVVLQELSNISSMEKISYIRNSRAIDIEKSLKERLEENLVKVGS
jgi:HD-like signal output (HDOD) protein